MRGRTAWVIGGAVAALVLAGGIVWFATYDAPPAATPSSAPPTSAPPTASVEERAQQALESQLTICAQSTAPAAPPHCGIRIPWGTDFSAVSSMRFRIEKMPSIAIDGDTFSAEGGALVATITGTGVDGTARTETYRTDDWAVRGDLVTEGDEVEVAIW